jgi:hypothetical protein
MASNARRPQCGQAIMDVSFVFVTVSVAVFSALADVRQFEKLQHPRGRLEKGENISRDGRAI